MNILQSKHPEQKPALPENIIPSTPVKVEPVIFEEIDADMILRLAKDLSGSGGPTKIDADLWKHILCCKSFNKVSSQLCQSIADTTKRLCTEDINSSYTKELFACRLIFSKM